MKITIPEANKLTSKLYDTLFVAEEDQRECFAMRVMTVGNDPYAVRAALLNVIFNDIIQSVS